MLPSWRIDDVDGPFDLFVNCFSFQEMEPDVVVNYVAKVAEKDVEWVVSLNSRKGKPKAMEHGNYCWMSTAYVMGAKLTDAFSKYGWWLRSASATREVVMMPESGK